MRIEMWVLSVAFAGAVLVAQSKSSLDGIYSAEQAKRGESAFLQNCTSCHGSDLGGTEGGPALRGPDFNAKWEGAKLNKLFDLMKTTMPQTAPGSLADRQYADIFAFMLSRNGFSPGQAELVAEEEALSRITYTVSRW